MIEQVCVPLGDLGRSGKDAPNKCAFPLFPTVFPSHYQGCSPLFPSILTPFPYCGCVFPCSPEVRRGTGEHPQEGPW